MNDTIRLGRLRGVSIGLNWTVLVIFVLVGYGLAVEGLPHAYRGLHPIVYALGGFGTAVAFLASLLAHELAHAIVARRNGLTVEGITLWLLGGVARFEGEPATPGAELRIAGSGPLVSLALGVVFGVGSALLMLAGVRGLVAGCLAWLAAINVALALFNVIPAAPLDGGRLVHALLWRLSGDRTAATLRASLAGRVFGWMLALGGFYLSLWSLSGLWLALVGWFLVGAATLEAVQARARARLEGVTVARIMTPDPFTVPGALTAGRFRREMLRQHRHAAYPVVDDGAVRGIVTAERVRGADDDTPLGELVEPAGRVAPDADLAALLPRLATERLLVIESGRPGRPGRLVGIVTPHDLTRELERLDRPW